MIRWDVFKRLIKFAYFLEVDEEDGMGWSEDKYSKNWPSSRTSWARRRGDEMISWEVLKQLIELTYILYRCRERDGIIRSEIFKQLTYTYELVGVWDGMIRQEIFKQLTMFTYILETDEENRTDDQKRGIQTIYSKFTYFLEADEEDGMGWSEERYSNNCLKVHVRPGDVWGRR